MAAGQVVGSERRDDDRGQHLQCRGRTVRVKFRGHDGLRGAQCHLARHYADRRAGPDGRHGRCGAGIDEEGSRQPRGGPAGLFDADPVRGGVGPDLYGPAIFSDGAAGPAAGRRRGNGAPVCDLWPYLHDRPARFYVADVLPVVLYDGGEAAAGHGDVAGLRRDQYGAGRTVHRGVSLGPRGSCRRIDGGLLRGRILSGLVFLQQVERQFPQAGLCPVRPQAHPQDLQQRAVRICGQHIVQCAGHLLQPAVVAADGGERRGGLFRAALLQLSFRRHILRFQHYGHPARRIQLWSGQQGGITQLAAAFLGAAARAGNGRYVDCRADGVAGGPPLRGV